MLDVRKFESIAKLNLPEKEREWIQKSANYLIESFEQLKEIETTGIDPMVSVLDLQNILREDECVQTISRDVLLSNAPEQYDGYFQVPKTLE